VAKPADLRSHLIMSPHFVDIVWGVKKSPASVLESRTGRTESA
jgi:hypothetical protein